VARIGVTAKKKKVVLEARDYQYPGEKRTYLQAVGGISAVFLIAAGITAYMAFKPATTTQELAIHGLWQIPTILLLYPLVTVLLLNYIAARPRRKEIKELGGKAKVMRTNRADLFALLQNEAAVLCLKHEPEAYVIDDDAPYLYSVPGKKSAIIISSRCLEILRPEEVAAALAHEMGHIKTGHVQVDLAITAVNSQNPLLKIVFLPVTLMAFIMRGWQDMIDYSADRVSLLYVGRSQTCTATMVKLAAAGASVTRVGRRDRRRERERKAKRTAGPVTDRDTAVDEAEGVIADISPEDLDAYLSAGGEMTEDPIQVERAFKISRFMDQQRNLKERIRNLGEFYDSDEGEAALQKAADIRAQVTGTQSASG
jgi:Zn-dependent protease with chaperone function